MKPFREDENANPNPALKFELWLQNTCNELAELRMGQRRRELAQPRLGGNTYVDHDLVSWR